MNRTNFEHAWLALAMQAVAGVIGWPFFGLAPALCGGALFAIAFFVSREHSQREQAISVYGIVPSDWRLGFKGWSLDSKLDAIFPAVAVVMVSAGALWLS